MDRGGDTMAIQPGTEADEEFPDLDEPRSDHAADIANDKMQYGGKSKEKAKEEAKEQAKEHDRKTNHII